LIPFLLILILTIPGIAQTPTYDDLVKSFEEFAIGVASTLPYNALVGLTWSDAHIKNFPHFGIGITVGATILPSANLEETFTLLGIDPATIDNPLIQSMLSDFGMPFPALSAEARMGGFFLPFDVGFKIGFVPQDFNLSMISDGFILNYFSVGGDLRFGLLKQWFMIPCISVGAGLTYQQGSIDIPGILGENMTIASVGPYSIELQDPALNFNWKTLVIDLKAQLSWDLFLFTPYIGTGASYGIYAEAGGGMKTQLLDGATGLPLTPEQIEAIILWCETTGQTLPDLTQDQILISTATPPAWAYRVYGGISVNFFIARVDATIMYNFLSGGIGGSVNVRIQL
jgi:hypothetical protein